jgi:hypothetical protein
MRYTYMTAIAKLYQRQYADGKPRNINKTCSGLSWSRDQSCTCDGDAACSSTACSTLLITPSCSCRKDVKHKQLVQNTGDHYGKHPPLRVIFLEGDLMTKKKVRSCERPAVEVTHIMSTYRCRKGCRKDCPWPSAAHRLGEV